MKREEIAKYSSEIKRLLVESLLSWKENPK